MKARKRSDISDLDVIRAYLEWEEGFAVAKFPIERLAEQFDCAPKIALRACERVLGHGFLEYGTSIYSAWVTPKGLELWQAKTGLPKA